MNRKRFVLYFWLAVVFCSVSAYVLYPGKFTFSFFLDFSESHHTFALLLYYSLVSLRGIIFIPTSAMTITCFAVFDPLELLTLNMLGILTSSAIVYRFSSYLGLDIYFGERYPDKIARLKSLLREKEIPVIVGWSSFPFVPTDVIVYVSSALRIGMLRTIISVMVGESILNAFYILSLSLIF